ncbi:hypothetical protein [Streptomyces anulatus]|uniref:hypothetical protein n=1 Tax=Streptomyces anulatus TaxID=1892 RepID=UPI00364220A8
MPKRPVVTVDPELVREPLTVGANEIAHTRFTDVFWFRTFDGYRAATCSADGELVWDAAVASCQWDTGLQTSPNSAPLILGRGVNLGAVKPSEPGPLQDATSWATTDLGNAATGRPALALGLDGALALYTCDENGNLALRRANGAGEWGPWQTTGWTAGGGVAAATPLAGTAVVVCVDPADGTVRVAESQIDGSCPEALQIASNASSLQPALPAAAVHENGLVEVFYRGDDGGLWHVGPDGEGGWGDPAAFGAPGPLTSITAALQGDGRMFCFATTGNELWVAEQSEPNGGWGELYHLPGGVDGAASPAVDADGTLTVFYKGTGPDQWYRVRDTFDTWGEESYFPGAIHRPPTPVSGPDHRIATLVQGDDHSVLINLQTAPGAVGWDTYARIGDHMSGPATALRDYTGRVHFARRGSDGHLYVTSQLQNDH